MPCVIMLKNNILCSVLKGFLSDIDTVAARIYFRT
jgi:hypothetical protein